MLNWELTIALQPLITTKRMAFFLIAFKRESIRCLRDLWLKAIEVWWRYILIDDVSGCWEHLASVALRWVKFQTWVVSIFTGSSWHEDRGTVVTTHCTLVISHAMFDLNKRRLSYFGHRERESQVIDTFVVLSFCFVSWWKHKGCCCCCCWRCDILRVPNRGKSWHWVEALRTQSNYLM